MPELYRVYSRVSEVLHRGIAFKDVNVIWLRTEDLQNPPIPYEAAIIGYAPNIENIEYPMGYISELFTYGEADRLIKHLLSRGYADIDVIKVPLPISQNHMGYADFPFGSNEGFLNLHAPCLKFNVVGYYCLDVSACAAAIKRAMLDDAVRTYA